MIGLSTFLFIGTAEVMVILVIVVLVFGADKIPEMAKGLGKGMRSLKDASNDIKSEIKKSSEQPPIDTSAAEDISKQINNVKDDIEDLSGSVSRGRK